MRRARDLAKLTTIGEYVICEINKQTDYVFVVLDNGTDRIIRKYLPKELIQ